eukprot:scaffold160960_cov29-Prasinocladus_malaysianus.AAC.1
MPCKGVIPYLRAIEVTKGAQASESSFDMTHGQARAKPWMRSRRPSGHPAGSRSSIVRMAATPAVSEQRHKENS